VNQPSSDTYSLEQAAQRLRVTTRWLRQQVDVLDVPHLRLARNRIAFTPDQYTGLLDALTRRPSGPTDRSRARARKGNVA